MACLFGSAHVLQEQELVLEQTSADKAGRFILCWATVILWVRLAQEDERLVCCVRVALVTRLQCDRSFNRWQTQTDVEFRTQRWLDDSELVEESVDIRLGLLSQVCGGGCSCSLLCLLAVQEMEPYLPLTSQCARSLMSGVTVLFWVSIKTVTFIFHFQILL